MRAAPRRFPLAEVLFITALLVGAGVISWLSGRTLVLTELFAPIQSGVQAITNAFSGGVERVQNLKSLEEENARLKHRITELEHTLVGGDGGVELPGRLEGVAKDVVRLGVRRLQRDRLPGDGDRPVGVAVLQQRQCEIRVKVRHRRHQLDGARDQAHGLGLVPLLRERDPEQVERRRVLGVCGEDPAVRRLRGGKVAGGVEAERRLDGGLRTSWGRRGWVGVGHVA